MSGTTPLQLAQATLEKAEADRAERTRLRARLERAEATHTETRRALRAARAELADESADVSRLEDFSPTLIWAVLRGNRDERLEAERAEARAAEYRAALAQSRHDAAEAELAATHQALDRLGDVDARRRQALDAKETALVAGAHPGAQELTALAERAGTARAELTEVEEALAAADAAVSELEAARKLLDSASDWAAFDTFGGGGFLTDLVKRQKMDEAVARMRKADQALHRLSAELGDLGRQGVGAIDIDGLTDLFDVWFDNIFSDWSVMSRIRETAGRVREAAATVVAVRGELLQRQAVLQVRLGDLHDRREALLLH